MTPDPTNIFAVFDAVKPAAGYGFLFKAVPVVMFAAGCLMALRALKNAPLSSRRVGLWSAGFLIGAAAFGYLNERYVLIYPQGTRCQAAGPEGFATLAPLFLPDDLRKFGPDGPSFDESTCEEFDGFVRKEAALALFATIGALTVSLGVTALFAGMISIGLVRSLRPAGDGPA